MRVVSKPQRGKRAPRPRGLRAALLPTGTVVEVNGKLWIKRQEGDFAGTWTWWDTMPSSVNAGRDE